MTAKTLIAFHIAWAPSILFLWCQNPCTCQETYTEFCLDLQCITFVEAASPKNQTKPAVQGVTMFVFIVKLAQFSVV